jgi:PIN domain nuclease of toxin-antitoxin system
VRALFDTHAFLWFTTELERVSSTARDVIEDGSNYLFLSAASAWEIAIKHETGRLKLPEPAHQFVINRIFRLSLQPLNIEMGHALRAGSLPRIHRDPFDRLLVAQSQLEGLPILTSDPNIARYGVAVIW